jgi:short-subunit dehydrogenase
MTQPLQPGAALITGASSGIGAVYADRLARRGHDLILVARDQSRLEDLAKRLRAETGVKIEVVAADLTLKADQKRVAARLAQDPAISTLVNNTGVAGVGDFVGGDIDRIETMIELNIVAVTRLASAAASAFAAAGRGTIINIGSVTSLIPEQFTNPYSATKAYVLSFSQSLDQELKDKGVRVQAVLPGATRTEIWERAGRDISTIPAEMLMGVEDLVDAALAGLEQGELVTLPSVPDAKDWADFTAARLKLAPNLSRNQSAARYGRQVDPVA